MKKKVYHKENCNSTVRATMVDQFGRTITLFGTHAFEWSISVESDGKITMQTFSNSEGAKREYKKYKKRK